MVQQWFQRQATRTRGIEVYLDSPPRLQSCVARAKLERVATFEDISPDLAWAITESNC